MTTKAMRRRSTTGDLEEMLPRRTHSETAPHTHRMATVHVVTTGVDEDSERLEP